MRDRLFSGRLVAYNLAPAIRNFGLDEFRQEISNSCLADVASVGGNDVGHALLHEVQLGSTRAFLQGDGRLDFTGQVWVVKFIRVTMRSVGFTASHSHRAERARGSPPDSRSA